VSSSWSTFIQISIDGVYSLWYIAPTMLPVGDQDEVEIQFHLILLHKYSLVLLNVGEIIARNMLS